MRVLTPVSPTRAPDDVSALSTLMAEQELTVSDPPLAAPQAGALILLLGLLALSPAGPKEPRK